MASAVGTSLRVFNGHVVSFWTQPKVPHLINPSAQKFYSFNLVKVSALFTHTFCVNGKAPSAAPVSATQIFNSVFPISFTAWHLSLIKQAAPLCFSLSFSHKHPSSIPCQTPKWANTNPCGHWSVTPISLIALIGKVF